MNTYRPTEKLQQSTQNYVELKRRLMDDFGLGADDEVLADTLEGLPENDLEELIVAGLLEAQCRKAMAEGLNVVIAAIKARQKRYMDGHDAIRASCQHAVMESGLTGIKKPAMTVSLKKNPPKLVIPDNDAVPHEWCQQIITWEPDKEKIQAGLELANTKEQKERVAAFAHMSNGTTSISVRTK